MRGLGKEQRHTLKNRKREWWIYCGDFMLRCFSHLVICHIQTEDLDNITADDFFLTEQSFHGQWVADLIAVAVVMIL
jgi:hypothetical protein